MKFKELEIGQRFTLGNDSAVFEKIEKRGGNREDGTPYTVNAQCYGALYYICGGEDVEVINE